ncbi:MAG: hypothetical protein ABJA98_17090 [Acidobacteriota bacterium]
MFVAYALEDRSPAFVLLFAAACGASSAYGFLAGAWPFGIVEAVWMVVAFRRWTSRSAGNRPAAAGSPIACDMTALSAGERRRYNALRPLVLGGIEEVRETRIGFRARIRRSTTVADIAEWIEMERRCCAFLDITLALNRNGTTWIEIGGTAAIKEFLKREFSALRVVGRDQVWP